jgi:hypothetical protein
VPKHESPGSILQLIEIQKDNVNDFASGLDLTIAIYHIICVIQKTPRDHYFGAALNTSDIGIS